MRKLVLMIAVAATACLFTGNEAQAFWKKRCGSSCGTCRTSCHRPCNTRCHKPCRTRCHKPCRSSCGDRCGRRRCGLFSIFSRSRCCHRGSYNTYAAPSCNTCGTTTYPSAEPVPAPATEVYLQPAG